MKRLSVALIALLVPLLARAEIFVSFKPDKVDHIPPVAKGPVKLRCVGCFQVRDNIKRKLEEAGYTIADDAPTEITIAAYISVPEDGRAPLEWIYEVYGKGLPPIPPAIKQQTDIAAPTPSGGGRQLQFDAGVMRELSGVTSSSAGAAGIAFGLNLLVDWFAKRQADAKRVPGIVKTSVHVKPHGEERKLFQVFTAANTPETPEALIDAAIDAAIHGLVNGVQEGKAEKSAAPDGKAEQTAVATPSPQQETQ